MEKDDILFIGLVVLKTKSINNDFNIADVNSRRKNVMKV